MSELARNRQLDGLRGYAAVVVVIFHSILDRDLTLDARIVRPTIQQIHGLYNIITKLALIVINGEAAVVLFFVLSGTVLFISLQQRSESALSTLFGFTTRRILRLYPAFFVALLGCLAAFALIGALVFPASRLWANAALVDFTVLGSSWTLQVEFLAIPFILIGFWSFRRFGVIGIVTAYIIFAIVLAEPWARLHLVRYGRFLPCFALGLLVPTRLGAALVARLPEIATPFALIAMLAIRSILGLHWWSIVIEEIFAALLVALLYYHRSGKVGLHLIRDLPQYLSRISYSLYLFNVVYLIIADHYTRNSLFFQSHPLEAGLLLAIPVLTAGILTAHFAEKVLERPSITFGHWLTRPAVG